MSLLFLSPNLLWLLLLLPLIWLVALASSRRTRGAQRWGSVALRSVATIALIGALAGAQLIAPPTNGTTIFLLDRSDSISPAQRASAEAYVADALKAMPPDDRAAIVTFGAGALVERLPEPNRELGQVRSNPDGAATDLAGAIQLGEALAPAEERRRMVLISDGAQNSGDAIQQAQRAAADGVPVDVVPLAEQTGGPDARITAVAMPATAREGQQLVMRLDVESGDAASGRLVVIDAAGAQLVDQRVQLKPGSQTYEVTLPPPPSGFNRYVARIEADGDTQSRNNRGEGYTFVRGKPQILLVEGLPGEAAALSGALQAAGFATLITSPEKMPTTIGALAIFDAVMLVNVPRKALSERAQSTLATYVHNLGRGLAMIGGPQAFGAGGWRGSPVESALPVTMDLPERFRRPPVSVTLVIDISGSMSAEENGRTKLSLAIEGAQRIASLLRDEDELTVIPFDSAPQQVVGPLGGDRRDEAIAQLQRVRIGGGGINIHDALTVARDYIARSDRPVKHLITLTDGDDTQQQEGADAIVSELRAKQVTVTSIAIGDGHDISFIQGMARLGGGRYFFTDNAATLPSILADETEIILRPYVIEKEFTPQLGASHPATRGLTSAPPLLGYVATTPRDIAQVLLATPDGEPILAVWQHGLGHAAAWTSDFTGRWGVRWVSDPAFGTVAGQLASWLLPAPESGQIAASADRSGGRLTMNATVAQTNGAPHTGLQVTALLASAGGVQTEVTLHEVAPGQYRGVPEGLPPGVYLAEIVARDASGEPVAVTTAGAVVPPSAEFGGGGDPQLLAEIARITGGRVAPAAAAAFAPGGARAGAAREIGLPLLWLALLLWPLDIAWRRFGRYRPAAVAAAVRTAAAEPAAVPTARERLPSMAERAERPPARSATPASKTDAKIDELRAAQDAARRRARGEE